MSTDTNSQTPTPRTDAAEDLATKETNGFLQGIVGGDFARQLEREDSALTAQVALLREALRPIAEIATLYVDSAPDEYSVKAKLGHCRKAEAAWNATAESAGAELAELRKDKARLDWLDAQTCKSIEFYKNIINRVKYRAAIDAAMQQEAKS